MKVADFNYSLPEELIAKFPPNQRTDSRLLKVMQGRDFEDSLFPSLVEELRDGDLLVLNNTKVLPARLFGKKESGGRVEVLLERITSESSFIAQVRASKAAKEGQKIIIEGGEDATLTVAGREGSFFVFNVEFDGNLFDWFERVGHMPLPPYIDRSDEISDQERYQTVFARKRGAVAAPTAGLHYDDNLLEQIRAKGVEIATVTLHVGAGTYQPVRVDNILEHVMHSEYIEVTQSTCDAVSAVKASGGRVVAVGTTVVRSLESAAQAASQEPISPFFGETDIFIYPGYEFKVVDLLQTNFHLPESTLLMLVSAFAGYELTMAAYQHAIENEYRFFSYGDAMLLERACLERPIVNEP